MITKSKDYFFVQMLIVSWIWVNKIGLEPRVQWGEWDVKQTNLILPKFWSQTFLYKDIYSKNNIINNINEKIFSLLKMILYNIDEL